MARRILGSTFYTSSYIYDSFVYIRLRKKSLNLDYIFCGTFNLGLIPFLFMMQYKIKVFAPLFSEGKELFKANYCRWCRPWWQQLQSSICNKWP